jgi:hypothetical protein
MTMWNIVKKDAKFVIFYFSAIVAVEFFLWILTRDSLSTAFVLISGVLVYSLVFGEIFINEQYEEKHHGYIFMKTLPVGIGEVVSAKFLRVLLSAFVFMGLTVLLITFAPGHPDRIVLVRSFVLFNGIVALIAAGFVFIGLFGMGYMIFLRVALSVLVLLQLIPFVLLSSGKMDVFVQSAVEFLRSINWLVAIPAGLAVYFGLMVVAIKVKTLRPS